jgi:hypothetical protein
MNSSNLTSRLDPVEQYFSLHYIHFDTLVNIYCYCLLPVCAGGIALNLVAACHLQGCVCLIDSFRSAKLVPCRRSWRNSAIRVYLLSLTVLDSLQLLFTAHVSVPYLCMSQDSMWPLISGLCSAYHDYMFRVLECASATIDTAHMWNMVALTAHRSARFTAQCYK